MKDTQLFDHHIHSEFSQDSTQNYEQLLQSAIKVGKQAFVTTEHYEPISRENNYFCMDIEKYLKTVAGFQQQYPEIVILTGIEIGYEPSQAAFIQHVINQQQFQIVIISIHTLFNGKDIATTCKKYGCWPYSDDPIRDYFQAALHAVETIEGFHIFGHLDYVLRYVERANFHISTYETELVAFFKKLIEKDIALDLNTSGWRYGLGQPHPQEALLTLYYELGGKRICLGSDAHVLTDQNADFRKAIELLNRLGFTSITSYETGVPQQIQIESIELV